MKAKLKNNNNGNNKLEQRAKSPVDSKIHLAFQIFKGGKLSQNTIDMIKAIS